MDSMNSLEALASRMRPILAERPEIAAAWIFGSAARGELRPDSDIDVGILLRTRGETAADHHRMIGALASRLETATAPHPVDVVVLETQGVMFAHRALVEGRLILEADRDRRIDFESDTVVRALDFAPTHALAVRGQAAGIRRRLRELP
jgi:predicted nucleotidyltransferase